MARESLVSNPFMLMTHPEVVMAAVEASERLKGLNRHLCRPLDRVVPSTAGAGDADEAADGPDLAADTGDVRAQ
jgi:hypothetical protein